jgi:phosphoserine phosphatase RsbU/P
MSPKSLSVRLQQATEIRERAEQELIQQHELMQQELQMAAEFQQAVLPNAVDLPYLNIAIIYRPFAEVSGDVYDFLQNREGELAIFLGDATGHGIAAALMTMMIHIGLDGIRRNLPTHESIRILNKLIASRETGRSVSGVFFRITPAGCLTVTHAGHPSLIVIPADGSALVQFDKGGCALGVFEDEPVPYEEESYQLAVGDKLVAYTDGVIEWSNHDKEIFGLQRLLETLAIHRHESIDHIYTSLTKELETFSEDRPCNDDLTALLLEFVGV